MTKEGKFARFLVERLQTSTENTAVYEIIATRFQQIFLEDKEHRYIVAVHNNEEKLFKISHRLDNDIIIATQQQEKTSTLKPYELHIVKNNIRFAELEDLIKHKVI